MEQTSGPEMSSVLCPKRRGSRAAAENTAKASSSPEEQSKREVILPGPVLDAKSLCRV